MILCKRKNDSAEERREEYCRTRAGVMSVILVEKSLVLPQAWTKYESNACFPDHISLKTDT